MPPSIAALLSATCLLTATVLGQAPPELITDRPDFTESPNAVPTGSIQLETGMTWERSGGRDAVAGPEALIRWSPAARVELRLNLPDYINTGDAAGLGDAGLGLKAELGMWGGWTAGGIASLTLPTGEAQTGSSRAVPELLLTVGRDVGASWSVGMQVAAALPEPDEAELAATLVLGAGLAKRIGSFVELFAFGPPKGPAALLMHHGYTLSLGPNMQADVHAGAGITGAAPAFLLGGGWSIRF